MSDLSVRDQLRTYSKGDLTRIAVLATRKQAAAERDARWRRAQVLLLMLGAFCAGAVASGWVAFFLGCR